MRIWPWFAASGAVLALSVTAACGPSYQALYEGDARFEHCYALEESGAAMDAKSNCWRDWMLRYTYGQTRDRKEYAAARYRALTRATGAPTDEAMMEAAPNAGRDVSIAAPAPTSAFAPPPKTLDELDASAPATQLPGYSEPASASTSAPAPAPVPEARPPGTSCADTCSGTWGTCKAKCTPGKSCDACSADYKKCMRGCFR